MDNDLFQLTIEQEFEIHTFAEKVKGLTLEEAQQQLKALYALMIRRDAMYKSFLAHEWGIKAPPTV
jgi:hypothetical protein